MGRGRPLERSELAELPEALALEARRPFPFSAHPAAPREILRLVAGSHAYGLARPESDVDVRGIYVIPSARLVGLGGKALVERTRTLQVEDSAQDATFYEVGHFCDLALACNPASLDLLFVRPEHVLLTTPEGEGLREIRSAFLSRAAIASYSGYARSQSARLRLRGPRAVDYDPKLAVHLLRLLQQAITLVRTGEVQVVVPERLAEELRAIYRQERPYSVVRERIDHLLSVFEEAVAESPLPQDPDRERIDAYLTALRRERWAA